MISNDRQYAITERRLKIFTARRQRLLRRSQMALNKGEAQQQIDSLQQKVELITKELKEYIGLRSGRIRPPDLSEISNLPDNLIRVRVALGWSPQEFARQFGIAPTQVHRWESSHYKSISLTKVLAVADLLNSALLKRQEHLID